MADIPDSIREKMTDYVRELNRHNIKVKTAIVFGSYASGNYHKWSDIDVALISDDFKGDSLLDTEMIANPTLKIDSRISPLTYRIEDFDETDLFIKKIVKTGVPIV